ncbi:MAG: hypothetical protein WCW44_04000 [archaeon]|jgi:guanylate kinase
MEGNVIIAITGTSGIGKGFLKDNLKERLGLTDPPWYTTRKKRKGETRPDRVFVNEPQFQKLIENGSLIFAQNLYGGDKYALHKSAFEKGGVITEIHIDVVDKFRKLFPNAILIGLTTNNIDFLKYRLKKRGDSQKEAAKRLAAAEKELAKTRRLHKVFNINYAVGFDNEKRIVQDIAKRIAQIRKSQAKAKRALVVKVQSKQQRAMRTKKAAMRIQKRFRH